MPCFVTSDVHELKPCSACNPKGPWHEYTRAHATSPGGHGAPSLSELKVMCCTRDKTCSTVPVLRMGTTQGSEMTAVYATRVIAQQYITAATSACRGALTHAQTSSTPHMTSSTPHLISTYSTIKLGLISYLLLVRNTTKFSRHRECSSGRDDCPRVPSKRKPFCAFPAGGTGTS
jgi:hypothetical protein